jgi:PIN domain nuclease of toxin-antitoxin system
VKVLLDTHTLLWFFEDEDRLSPQARQILRLRSTVPFVSVVSLWEIAIKLSRGKLEFDRPLSELIDEELPSNGIELLAVDRNHLLKVQQLPFPYEGHADPFDRMLVAQALTEEFELLSADTKLDAYGVRRVW